MSNFRRTRTEREAKNKFFFLALLLVHSNVKNTVKEWGLVQITSVFLTERFLTVDCSAECETVGELHDRLRNFWQIKFFYF